MTARERLDLLRLGMRSARSGPVRRFLAGGVLVTLLVLYLLLVLFPGLPMSGDPRELLPVLAARPSLFAVYLVAAAVLAFAIGALVAGAAIRETAEIVAGRPGSLPESFAFARRRWGRLFAIPLAAFAPVTLLLLFAFLFLQVVRIPIVGWPLLVLLSPAVVACAAGAAGIVLRLFLVAHLLLAGTAAEGLPSVSAISRSFTWLRARPFSLVGLRTAAAALSLVETAIRLAPAALGLAGVVLLLRWIPGDPLAGPWETLRSGFGTVGPGADLGAAAIALVLVGLFCWYAALALGNEAGAATALYLLHRRELDGVPVDAPLPGEERGKSLEELGMELVERIRGQKESA